MLLFFEKYPNKKIYFRGSNEVRTRIYGSLISKFIEIIELYFSVLGLRIDGEFEKFTSTQPYVAFIIFQK
jgi:uncharacterized Fe-S cluster-containing protein